MIHIAIVDDEVQARENLKACLEFVSGKEGLEFRITEFPSGRAFIGNYQPIYDIVMMDIEMPGEDGLETAHMLRRMDKSVILMFVTNMAQHAIRGYEVDALDFIVKPLNKYGLLMKMNRAVARTAKRLDDVIKIKTDGEVFSVQTSTIKYLEVNGHYVVYHTVDGDYSEYITLKNAEEKIGKKFFVRCNRYLLVNLRYVDSVKRDSVIVGGEELVISRPQKKSFLSAYSDFLGGKLGV